MMKTLIIALCFSAASVCAEEPPSASLRLLALGELPPFRQEIRDGVRRELDPPEGSIPPRSLEAGLPVASPEDATAPTFRLQLSMASQPAKVFPVDGTVKLHEPGQGEWTQVRCPAGTRTLAVLWKPGDSWQKPMTLSLPELAPDHDPRVFRFVNVAPQTVGVAFGEKRYQLESGKTLTLTLPDGAKAASVSIFFADPSGALKPCFSSVAEAKENSATQYFIHRADGETPRRPVQVTPLSGPLRTP